MSSINQDITLTQSLAEVPRNQLEKWLEDVEIHARNLCAQWDISGALTLVATDEVWAEYPGNVTNSADVLANGDPRLLTSGHDQPGPHRPPMRTTQLLL